MGRDIPGTGPEPDGLNCQLIGFPCCGKLSPNICDTESQIEIQVEIACKRVELHCQLRRRASNWTSFYLPPLPPTIAAAAAAYRLRAAAASAALTDTARVAAATAAVGIATKMAMTVYLCQGSGQQCVCVCV